MFAPVTVSVIVKTATMRSWMAAEGDEASFEQNWSQIRDEMRREPVKREADAQRRSYERAARACF